MIRHFYPALLFFLSAFLLVACPDDAATGDPGDGGDVDGTNNHDGADDDGDVQRTDGGTFADDFEQCTALSQTAQNTRGPADVILAVDNTPSMYNEIEEVRANLNRLSQMVADEGLDLRVMLIGCRTEGCLNSGNWHTICIDPPLGAEGACAVTDQDDSNPPAFLHVDSKVESRKGLESIIDTSADWLPMLRDGAAKHVIIVSDDNDDWTAAQFETALTGLDARLNDFQFHGIFAYLSKEDACAISDQEPCCTYAAPGGEGAVYRELVQRNDGVSGDMCLQDFDLVFDQLAGAVVASARLNCEWAIPEPPEGMDLDPALVNLEFSDGQGTVFQIGRITSAAQCPDVEHGWYFDDAESPTTILICPQTCAWIQGRVGAAIDVWFGCESEWIPVE